MGGVEDGAASQLADTFPRSSPFVSKHRGKDVHWITISSRRRAGLLNAGGAPHQLLWMFAIDAEKIADGMDGSFPAFYLPFQDLDTSNHIGQWTEEIVTDEPPPPPPADPPQPPPPPPPPIPE
jgi:hypothetical protein